MDFKQLPYLIQIAVFEKFDYYHLLEFEKCSQISKEFCARRSSTLFPYEMEEIFIQNEIIDCFGEDDEPFIEISNPPAVWLESEVLFLNDPLTPEIHSFMMNRIRGIEKMFVYDIKQMSPLYNDLFNQKTFQLTKLTICLKLIRNNCPTDFGEIETVQIVNEHNLSLDTILSIKTKKKLIVEQTSLSYDDFSRKLQDWLNGEEWHTPIIDLAYCDSDFSFFADEFSEDFPSVKKNTNKGATEWIFKRKEGHFKYLFVKSNSDWDVKLIQKKRRKRKQRNKRRIGKNTNSLIQFISRNM